MHVRRIGGEGVDFDVYQGAGCVCGLPCHVHDSLLALSCIVCACEGGVFLFELHGKRLPIGLHRPLQHQLHLFELWPGVLGVRANWGEIQAASERHNLGRGASALLVLDDEARTARRIRRCRFDMLPLR